MKNINDDDYGNDDGVDDDDDYDTKITIIKGVNWEGMSH